MSYLNDLVFTNDSNVLYNHPQCHSDIGQNSPNLWDFYLVLNVLMAILKIYEWGNLTSWVCHWLLFCQANICMPLCKAVLNSMPDIFTLWCTECILASKACMIWETQLNFFNVFIWTIISGNWHIWNIWQLTQF